MKKSVLLLAVPALAVLAACTHQARDDVTFRPTATVQEIMLAVIDPNIDAVWNSVSTVTTAKGTEERRPQTQEDWDALRQHALTVVEAGNLLLVDGRQVAKKGASTSSGGAELNPADIQRGIDAQRTEYRQRALGLHDAALTLITAIDRKNPDELVEAGGRVERACEQCHSQFWYPNDRRPK